MNISRKNGWSWVNENWKRISFPGRNPGRKWGDSSFDLAARIDSSIKGQSDLLFISFTFTQCPKWPYMGALKADIQVPEEYLSNQKVIKCDRIAVF